MWRDLRAREEFTIVKPLNLNDCPHLRVYILYIMALNCPFIVILYVYLEYTGAGVQENILLVLSVLLLQL